LFANTSALDVANLKKYAAGLKLDSSQFDPCLDSGKHAQAVNNDLAEGSALGRATVHCISGGNRRCAEHTVRIFALRIAIHRVGVNENVLIPLTLALSLRGEGVIYFLRGALNMHQVLVWLTAEC
jgi:hypothetical protein